MNDPTHEYLYMLEKKHTSQKLVTNSSHWQILNKDFRDLIFAPTAWSPCACAFISPVKAVTTTGYATNMDYALVVAKYIDTEEKAKQ